MVKMDKSLDEIIESTKKPSVVLRPNVNGGSSGTGGPGGHSGPGGHYNNKGSNHQQLNYSNNFQHHGKDHGGSNFMQHQGAPGYNKSSNQKGGPPQQNHYGAFAGSGGPPGPYHQQKGSAPSGKGLAGPNTGGGAPFYQHGGKQGGAGQHPQHRAGGPHVQQSGGPTIFHNGAGAAQGNACIGGKGSQQPLLQGFAVGPHSEKGVQMYHPQEKGKGSQQPSGQIGQKGGWDNGGAGLPSGSGGHKGGAGQNWGGPCGVIKPFDKRSGEHSQRTGGKGGTGKGPRQRVPVDRKAAKNTQVYFDKGKNSTTGGGGGDLVVKLYDTPVAVFRKPNGTKRTSHALELRTGGHHTAETRFIIGECLALINFSIREKPTVRKATLKPRAGIRLSPAKHGEDDSPTEVEEDEDAADGPAARRSMNAANAVEGGGEVDGTTTRTRSKPQVGSPTPGPQRTDHRYGDLDFEDDEGDGGGAADHEDILKSSSSEAEPPGAREDEDNGNNPEITAAANEKVDPSSSKKAKGEGGDDEDANRKQANAASASEQNQAEDTSESRKNSSAENQGGAAAATSDKTVEDTTSGDAGEAADEDGDPKKNRRDFLMARLTMLKAKNKPSDGKSVELVASSGPSTSSTKPKAYAPWIVSGKLPNGTLFEEQFYEGMEIPLPYCFVSLGRFRFQLQERLLNILNGNTAGPLDGGSHPPMKGNNNHMGNQLYSNTNRGSGHQNSGPHHQSRAVLLTGPNGDGGLQTGPTGRSDETTPQHSSSMSGASLVISSSTTPGGQHRQQHSTRLVESGAPDAATSQLVQQVLSALPRTGGQPQQVIVHHQRPATGGTITGTPGAPLVLVHDSRASPSVQVQYATPVQQPQVVHLVSAEDTRWARSVSTGPLTPASMTMNATTSTNIRLVPASQVRGRSVSSMSGATGGGLTTSNAKSNKKRDYSQQKGSSSASSSSSAHDDRYGADVATPRGTPKRKRRKNADPRVYGVGDASSAPTGSIFVNGSVVGTSSAAASQFVRGVGGQSYIAQSVLPQHQTILHQGGPTSLATALSAASFGTQNARDLVQQASAAGTAASSPIIPARQATAGTVWMSDADLQFQ